MIFFGVILVLIASIPLPGSYFFLSFYVLTALAGLLSTYVAASLAWAARLPMPNGLGLVLTLLAVLGLQGLVRTDDMMRLVKEFAIFLNPIMAYLLLLQLWPRSDGAAVLQRIFTTSLIILMMLQLPFLVFGFATFESRFLFRKEYVLLSTQALVLFPLILGWASPRYRRTLILGAVLTIAATLSREGQLFLFFWLIFLLVRDYMRYLWRPFLTGIAIFPLVYFVGIFFFGLDGGTDMSAGWRILEVVTLLANLDAGELSTWFGHGFGSYLTMPRGIPINGEIVTEIPRFHNFWLYLIFKFGVLGFLLVYGYVLSLIVKPIPINKRTFATRFVTVYFLCVSGSFWGLFTMSAASCVVIAFLMWSETTGAYRVRARQRTSVRRSSDDLAEGTS